MNAKFQRIVVALISTLTAGAKPVGMPFKLFADGAMVTQGMIDKRGLLLIAASSLIEVTDELPRH